MALADGILSGQFMLTELGHGLDISNMETTATQLPSGDFLLNSPTPSSAKLVFMLLSCLLALTNRYYRAMPPTVPAGLPCIAVVFARLIVNGEFRGHRPFVVPLNDGRQMCTGIQSRYAARITYSVPCIQP